MCRPHSTTPTPPLPEPTTHTSNGKPAYLIAGRERHEVNVRRGQSVVTERPLDSVQVVRPDGHEGTAAADVLVQLVLRDTDEDTDTDKAGDYERPRLNEPT